MLRTIPNWLTLSRIILLPPLIACFYLEADYGAGAIWACFSLYTLICLTDFLDGYLARKWNQITPLGTFLDPIADKILVAAVLITLVGFGRLDGLWLTPVIVIFVREFLVSGLREYLGPHNVQMPVSKLAKWKTAAQMIAVGLLIIGPHAPLALDSGRWLLALAAALTVLTGWQYLKIGLEHLRKMP